MIIEDNIQVDLTPKNNTILGTPELVNTEIVFPGKGNILVAEDNVRLHNCKIDFKGDNACVYLSSNQKHIYHLALDVWRETTFFFGKDSYFNGVLHAIASERQNIIIGNKQVFSFDVWLRTVDPHLIYDCETKERLNASKSILIGDHTWIGQRAFILKGSVVGSGSVLAAGAVLAGKKMQSNTVYAGNPAKVVKTGIFFTGASVHNYTRKQTKQSQSCESDEFIYHPGERLDTSKLFKSLTKAKTAEERLELLQTEVVENPRAGRFYIPPKSNPSFQKRMRRVLQKLRDG